LPDGDRVDVIEEAKMLKKGNHLVLTDAQGTSRIRLNVDSGEIIILDSGKQILPTDSQIDSSDEWVNTELVLTPELYNLLDELSETSGVSKGEVIRKALLLFYIATSAVQGGGSVTVNEVTPGGVVRSKQIEGLVIKPEPVESTASFGAVGVSNAGE
jgi:hypothetical protein